MDNFYKALSSATVKPSGVMNYIQHLFIAGRCYKNASVLDICCGRALMVPLLKTCAPHIARYVGLDISLTNLSEALEVIRQGDGNPPSFPCNFILGDVTCLPISLTNRFDVVVYISALEHLDRESGIISIKQIARTLAENGTLYLSTPRTPREFPRKLQYKVHLYEWDRGEIEEVLNDAELTLVECIGLLPPSDEILEQAIGARFGIPGVSWFREMRRMIPYTFLASVMASCFPEVAKELLYVCERREHHAVPGWNSG